MAVAVFGQLDHLLRERNLSVVDLKHQIMERHELIVDEAMLEPLASNRRLKQTDLTLVAAVTNVLGVSLDDLLVVVTIPFSAKRPPTKVNLLNEEETWRLWMLLGLQSKRELSVGERQELDSIIDEAERRADDDFWCRQAQQRGISPEEIQREREEDERVVKAMKQHQQVDADAHREDLVKRPGEQRIPASR